jgi:mannose-6-phosphate isomerase-like protein (cupin superfamily)
MRLQDLVVHPDAVATYEPARHPGTVNRTLVPPPGISAGKLEVALGVVQPGGQALLHVHEDLDQAVYVLEGRCRVSDGKESAEAGQGEIVYFPAGFPHEITALGPDPLRILVILAPPLHR